MEHTPRAIFAMIRADMREEVLSSNTPWYCVSCYYCTVRCPQDVHITDIMYTLKRMAVDARLYDQPAAPDFSKVFINWVENYGRAFELGLMSQHMLRHNPSGCSRWPTWASAWSRKGAWPSLPSASAASRD
jgi:heterodisulfide reductase subunit C